MSMHCVSGRYVLDSIMHLYSDYSTCHVHTIMSENCDILFCVIWKTPPYGSCAVKYTISSSNSKIKVNKMSSSI
jgi:hypothetical protein